ncbi:MAG: TRAP transporter substrate-binding protein [Desulfarculus sp.]|nr:TRAP transporter substrate-binding protein [Pseudomonadota bacterium]MBU4598502.1 TRAP transporter substrate-binding protein [Pseudomonadota bacterium]MBV1736837.1 TRAP transporter substrate-binding protein [Desulfarculus sp.]
MRSRSLATLLTIMLLLLGTATMASAMNLRFNIVYGPKHPLAKGVFKNWSEQVKKVTEGRVKVTIFHASALAKITQVFDATVSGQVDGGLSCPTYSQDRFPLAGVLDQPMVATSSAENNSATLWKLYEKYPEMQKEFNKVKVLWFYTNPAFQLHFTKREVRNLEELKGAIVSAGGSTALQMLKALGANPEALPMPEVFLALQKGVVEGCFLPYPPLRPRRMTDILTTHTVGDFSATGFYVIMNQKKWNKISPKDQKAIMEVSGLAAAKMSGRDFDQAQERDVAWMKKKGDKFYVLDKAERAKWIQRVKPIRDAWVNDLEAKGLPAKAVLADALEMLGK